MPLLKQKLSREDGHCIAFDRIGKKNGIPTLFLHGGPGGRITPDSVKLFEESECNTLFFDQRGCGRSTPSCAFHHNDTAHLIQDIELLRQKEKIDKWLVVGGSWGATLALCYAQQYATRITALILRGVFLGTQDEVITAFQKSAQLFRPELWHDLKERASEKTGKKIKDEHVLSSWQNFIICPEREEDRAAAWIWHDYERILSDIKSTQKLPSWQEAQERKGFPTSPFLEFHYIKNNFFIKTPLLDNPPCHIPISLVAGRYDLLCPPQTAFMLKQKWGANARLILCEEAGHHAFHASIRDALRQELHYHAKASHHS